MLPKVSVVITCYNYATYLPFAVDSALAQTYENVEIIIIDDGSQDNTSDVIKPYLKDSRIRFFSQPNQGQAIAKNNGIKKSTGEFIAFLDADDIWDINKLSFQIPLFSKSSTGIVYSLVKNIDQDGCQLNTGFKRIKFLRPRRGKVTKWLLFDNFIPFSSSVVRKKCFNCNGLFNEDIGMGIDWDLWLRLSLNFDFDYVNKPLLAYRVGHSNQMSKNFQKRRVCADRIFDTFVQYNRKILLKQWIRKAKSYTLYNIGYSAIKTDLKKARNLFIQSIILDPFNLYSIKGIVKTYFKKY